MLCDILKRSAFSTPALQSSDNSPVDNSNIAKYLEYSFGSSNSVTYSAKVIADEVFLSAFKESFRRTDLSPYDLDRQMSYLIHQWEVNHSPGSGNSKPGSGLFGGGGMLGSGMGVFRSVRCAGLMILNESKSTIKIISLKLITGERLCVFGDGSYLDGSNSIPPHSAVIIFVCGSIPKLIETSDASAFIQTTAFNVSFGRKQEATKFESSSGFDSRFLEKSFGGSWGKFILMIV
jgi:hypothetical protein